MPENTDETILELSKPKIILAIAGSALFVGLGFWFFTIDAADIRSGRSFTLFFNSPVFAYFLGAASIVFFGVVGAFMVKKVFDNKPGLIFNSSGITDNASAAAAGFIPWSEIKGSHVFGMSGTSTLVVLVTDPEKYIGRGGIVKRRLNRSNSNMVGSPVSIPSTALAIDFDHLQSLFDEYFEKYGPKSSD